jgi:ADP-ribose pyrophosphatase
MREVDYAVAAVRPPVVADESTGDYTETQLTSRLVYDGKMLKVREDSVRTPDGKTARREWVGHPGAVIIIALLDETTVIMERQFRYALRRHFYELPAGKIEAGEQPLATAQRELLEECGYTATEWRHLATLHPCVGYSDERFELYLAHGLQHVGRQLDEGEFLDVVPMAVDEVLRGIKDGRITDVKAVAGVAWLKCLL